MEIEKEWSLSNKIEEIFYSDGKWYNLMIPVEDVKKFIKKLKEKAEDDGSGSYWVNVVEIDKLVGERLK